MGKEHPIVSYPARGQATRDLRYAVKVGLAALAKHFQVHPGELALWHRTQLLVIHLNDHGVIRLVRT